jgi:hypothetical protein
LQKIITYCQAEFTQEVKRMNRIPITEAAKQAGITREQARYWSRLLDLDMLKDGRVSYLPSGAENMLLAMAQAVKSGQAPSVAAAEIKATFAAPAIVPPEQPENNTAIIARLNDLESAVLLLVQSNQSLSADNKQLSERNTLLLDLVQKQNRKLENIAARLPAPPPEVAPIRKIRKIQKTEVKLPLLKRLWLELFDPVKLRATP